MFKHFNNLLALVLVALIVGLWVLEGLGTISALPEISGATIAAFTLIVQYYFRKAPPVTPTSSTTTTSSTSTTAPANTPPAKMPPANTSGGNPS